MSAPEKRSGFSQGLHEISSTAKETVGIKRRTADGRIFRYAKAGSSALSAGKMGVAPQVNAGFVNEDIVTAAAIGAKQIVLTVDGGAAIVENGLAGGFLQVNDATGEGLQYLIESNSAVGSSGTSVTVNLAEPIVVALTTSSEITLVPSPWYGVTESATEENLPVGIPPVAVTAAYYYWAQTGGPAICLTDGTPAVGSMLRLATPAGALAVMAASVDVDVPVCAVTWACAGRDGEYCPIFLKIDS